MQVYVLKMRVRRLLILILKCSICTAGIAVELTKVQTLACYLVSKWSNCKATFIIYEDTCVLHSESATWWYEC